jgi:N-acetylmuramoyl-L-alanine amidase
MLKPGDRGELVTSVTTTLNRLGFLSEVSESFDTQVSEAIRAFQQARGLSVSGLIDSPTEKALEEARWKLGDRSLQIQQPHMRGDDVASLQSRLVEMGFNPGRVDGIYGPATENAVKDFQKSVGTKVDGICGPGTVISLMRLMRTVSGGAPTELRAQADRAKRGPALADKVIVLDPSPRNEISPLTFDLAQKIEGRLIALGVSVFLSRGATSSPSESERINFANSVNADLVISIGIDNYKNDMAHGISTYFYGSDQHGIHSLVGERFATLAQREICARTDLANNRTHAKTWDLLRLTKAPTIRLELGYITNPKDAARLNDPTFRDTVAEGIVIAIQRLFLSAEEDAKTGTLRIEDLRRAGIRN